MNDVIVGSNIMKSYGRGADRGNVLNGVSVSIRMGEFVAVMGPSGCGKTTLLFALSGTDEINGGSVKIDGKELSELKEKQLADFRRNKMGFVFQQPTMLKNLSILDNIILPSMQENRKNKEEIIGKARKLMKNTGISDLENRNITEVSGGQLQRAGICRALMCEPTVLFADEPTGALNSKASEEIMALFASVNRGGTAIFLVTHDAKVAAAAERILFMKDGRMHSELCFTDSGAQNADCRKEKIQAKMREIDI